jgi:2-dehydro-3-deoxyphosphogluconate aldolase/(4S)-4-hydroxy-2-oxoglutarate aldolase
MTHLVDELKKEKLVAIIRGIAYKDGEAIARALKDGGITFLEVTLNTDNALQLIEDLNVQFDGELIVGAGTVLNVHMAKEAVAAGATYLVSPNLDEAVIEYGVSCDVDVWPGTLTPTEIVRAFELGASAVKVFPIGAVGDDYLKNIRGPLPHIPMMVTGGVTLNNMIHFFSQGAVAVGLGSNLVNNTLIAKGEFSQITAMAKKYSELVNGGLAHDSLTKY